MMIGLVAREIIFAFPENFHYICVKTKSTDYGYFT